MDEFGSSDVYTCFALQAEEDPEAHSSTPPLPRGCRPDPAKLQHVFMSPFQYGFWGGGDLQDTDHGSL